ncbi:MAG TPA: NADPH-dependent F420 reductase [Rubrobacteraceae bacterium]|nr:NADPH-dependent F420 reductase [Rubrobacteraceae bacterium]
MQVTIIGTGNMGRGIATRLLAGGHEVTLLDGEAGKSEELVRELGGSVGAGAVGDPIVGDVVVLAVPYDAAAPLVQQYGEGLTGKVVVDITNPVDWQTFDGLVTPPDSSAAEEIQKAASGGARVVKAFNTTFAGTLVEGRVAGQPLDVFIAGDDGEAKETVAQLVRDGGLVAIDAGPLRRARELERLGFFGMTLQQPLGLSFQSAWKLTS